VDDKTPDTRSPGYNTGSKLGRLVGRIVVVALGATVVSFCLYLVVLIVQLIAEVLLDISHL